jgi:heavy-metal resistance protein CzcE
MLKRNIAMLIGVGVGLLGANVNLAVAQSVVPRSVDESNHQMVPAQDKYHARHEEALKLEAIPAQAQSAFPRSVDESNRQRLPAEEQYLAQRERALQLGAKSGDARTVKATAGTKYLNVAHEETVKIVNDQGQSFVWKADTLGEADLALQAIAPRDFVAGQTRVFVRHPYLHTVTD